MNIFAAVQTISPYPTTDQVNVNHLIIRVSTCQCACPALSARVSHIGIGVAPSTSNDYMTNRSGFRVRLSSYCCWESGKESGGYPQRWVTWVCTNHTLFATPGLPVLIQHTLTEDVHGGAGITKRLHDMPVKKPGAGAGPTQAGQASMSDVQVSSLVRTNPHTAAEFFIVR